MATPDFFLFFSFGQESAELEGRKACTPRLTLPPNIYGNVTFHQLGHQLLARRGDWARLPVSPFSYFPLLNRVV